MIEWYETSTFFPFKVCVLPMTFFATAKQLRKIESDNLNEGYKRKQNTRARVKDNANRPLILSHQLP